MMCPSHPKRENAKRAKGYGKKIVYALLFSEEGTTAVEYAIMASLIAAVIATVVGLLGLGTSTT